MTSRETTHIFECDGVNCALKRVQTVADELKANGIEVTYGRAGRCKTTRSGKPIGSCDATYSVTEQR